MPGTGIVATGRPVGGAGAAFTKSSKLRLYCDEVVAEMTAMEMTVRP